MCGDCDYAKVCRGCAALAYSESKDPFGEMIHCNKKIKIDPKIHEPLITCSEDEEYRYLTNNLENSIRRDGIRSNMNAIKHNIYKEFTNI